jgi:RHS repeat-associated protein
MTRNSSIDNFSDFTGAYCFGFNGKESDIEIEGTLNSYTTEYRQYDSRIGRWLTIDPLTINACGWTPYRAFFDNPLVNTDNSGLYEVDVKLSSKTKSDIKQKHKESGEKNWRKQAKNELNEIKKSHIEKAQKAMNEARQAVESDSGVLQDVEKILGAQKGSDDYNNYFENNGKGPKITIDEDLDYSGETYKGKLTIGGLVHSDESRKATILHEYAHYAQQKLGVVGDGEKTGYIGIKMTTEEQLKVINEAIGTLPISVRLRFCEMYKAQGNLDRNGNPEAVEGGYVLEKIVFGKITHRPISR